MASLSFPANPTDGQVYNGPNGVRYQYNSGRGWSTKLDSTANLYGANPGNTPPTGASLGTLWFDTDTNILYVYKNVDGNAEWVAIQGSGGGSSSTAAAGISLEGVAYYDGNIETDVGINLELQPES